MSRPALGEVLELVGFVLAGERYGIESRFVREVARLTRFTPVPGTPAFVLGVTNLRGEILALFDLRHLLGIVTEGVTDLGRIVVLGEHRREFGLLADAASDILYVPGTSLARTEAAWGRAYLRGRDPRRGRRPLRGSAPQRSAVDHRRRRGRRAIELDERRRIHSGAAMMERENDMARKIRWRQSLGARLGLLSVAILASAILLIAADFRMLGAIDAAKAQTNVLGHDRSDAYQLLALTERLARDTGEQRARHARRDRRRARADRPAFDADGRMSCRRPSGARRSCPRWISSWPATIRPRCPP